jgi:hypothetical protein
MTEVRISIQCDPNIRVTKKVLGLQSLGREFGRVRKASEKKSPQKKQETHFCYICGKEIHRDHAYIETKKLSKLHIHIEYARNGKQALKREEPTRLGESCRLSMKKILFKCCLFTSINILGNCDRGLMDL